MQEPDVQEHKTPLLEVKLQRPIVIRTVCDCWYASTEGTVTTGLGGDDGDMLVDDHKRDKKVGIMVIVGWEWRKLFP